jgi:hypothetical protein
MTVTHGRHPWDTEDRDRLRYTCPGRSGDKLTHADLMELEGICRIAAGPGTVSFLVCQTHGEQTDDPRVCPYVTRRVARIVAWHTENDTDRERFQHVIETVGAAADPDDLAHAVVTALTRSDCTGDLDCEATHHLPTCRWQADILDGRP